jgi:hypothetical protein
MEYNNQTSKSVENSAWLILLLAVAAGAAALIIPFGLIVVPALWAYAGARTKPGCIALPAAVYALGAMMLYSENGYTSAVAVSVMAAASAVALYVLLTKRFSNTYTALTLSGIFYWIVFAASCPAYWRVKALLAAVQAPWTRLFRFTARLCAGRRCGRAVCALVNEYLDTFSKACRQWSLPRSASLPA